MLNTSKSRVLMGGGLVMALALTGCASGGASPAPTDKESSLDSMDPIVLTYSDSNVETAAHVIAMQEFMEQVTEATDGKITFETYYAAALHPVTESLSAIQSGLTDITFVSPSNVPDLMPAALWETTIAQSAIEPEFPMSLIQGTPVQSAAYEEGPLADELAAYDAETLVTWGTAPNSVMCKSEVTSADQAAGKTIRTPGPPFLNEVEELTMTNVTLPVTDVFEGLQRGVIDCFMNVISPFITLGIWDEAKYFIPAHFASSYGSQLLIKKSVLEELPIEAQQIIFDARVDLLANIVEASLERNVQWANEAPAKGVTFVDPTSFNKAIDAARDAYTEAALDEAPAAIADPKAFADELGEFAGKWDELAGGLEIESGSPSTQEGWIELYRSVEDIDWDAYRDALHEYLAPYRP
ncbi:TRAP transporter substrate-binding protein DctP [Agromyces sp. Marseille-P2726]|uniref:TRAP transporter substrate-binding protein DctP n=1 Tax=Agromyces sp. Marseille-P2726 TaxID=2709132 RepID=UPI00156EDB31|nr:TRAP transporter substrate-binding protein DctP [Agromyces sp. Marseille-P2726]